MKKIPGLPTKLEHLDWKDYPGDRVIAHDPAGFHVILPKSVKKFDPLSCHVCDCLISTVDDVKTQETHGACQHCVDRYYYPNSQKWKEGWRPTVTDCNCKKTITLGL